MSDPTKNSSLAERISSPEASATTKSWDSWSDEAANAESEKQASATTDSKKDNDVDSQPTAVASDHEVQVKLSDLQADINSPLYSAKTFEELGINPQILKGLYAMNFSKPSKIQERALPLLLRDPPTNMIAQSQSGTGKTAAFVITVLSRIDYTKPKQPQALVIAPSRELARQIEMVIRKIGEFVEGLTIQAAIPGVVERGAAVEAMVVVGTPGTVMDLIKRRQFDASQLKLLVLDEADNMLDQQGLGDQCLRVKHLTAGVKQILLFSATFPEAVMHYATQFCPNANEIKLKRDELTVSGIQQMYMDCRDEEEKYDVLTQLYGLMTIGSSIIFVKTRESASGIAASLTKEGHKVVAIHGAFDGAERDSILNDFREGKAKVLITTNVLARGIDVNTVSMVINYDVPMKGRGESEPDPETYLHRIGRTGRFGRVGVSITFVYTKKTYQALTSICKEYDIDLIQLDQNDWDKSEQIVKKVIKTAKGRQ